eukprot:1468219-Rhodomonas_salina.2
MKYVREWCGVGVMCDKFGAFAWRGQGYGMTENAGAAMAMSPSSNTVRSRPLPRSTRSMSS